MGLPGLPWFYGYLTGRNRMLSKIVFRQKIMEKEGKTLIRGN